MSFRQTVEADLKGSINEEQKQMLRGNLEEWRRTLAEMMREIDHDLIRRKHEGDLKSPAELKKKYHQWRSSAVSYKSVLIGRISEVKTFQKFDNVNERDSLVDVLDSLLVETKKIRQLLESMASK